MTLDELLTSSGYTIDGALAMKKEEAEEESEESSSEDEDTIDGATQTEEPKPTASDAAFRP